MQPPTPPIQVASVPPTWVRYRVVGWLTVAAALAYLCRNSIGVMESTIREELELTESQSGWFQGAFFWTYAVMQVPAGWFAQVVGARLALALMAVSWSLASALIGMAPTLMILIVAQALMGIAQAGVIPCATNCLSNWASLRRRSISSGSVAMGLQIGAIVAGALTAKLLGPLTWRWIYLVYAVPGVIWAAWFYARFRNHPEDDPAVNAAERAVIRAEQPDDPDRRKPMPTPWMRIITSVTTWQLFGQQICRSAGYIFFVTWFPTFLQQEWDVSKARSGFIQSLVLGGSMVGYLIGGAVTDRVWAHTRSLRLSRIGVSATAQFICGLCILGAYYATDLSLAVALFSIGALCTAVGGTNFRTRA